MKLTTCVLALAALELGGCVTYETPVPAPTTTVTQEVTTTAPSTEVLVAQEPPAVRVETQTTSPGPNYLWTRGYWRWNGVTYIWVPGSWIIRPRPAAVYVEGHWLRRGSRWVWVPGHWG
jgi:hypothetical protein